tara:strand:- start:4145 stop:4603 length:459 start_codon:yes stop_codon:yes gene_type:complete
MAKQLSPSLHSSLDSLLFGSKTPSRLTPAVAVQLAALNILEVQDGQLVLNEKVARRRMARFLKRETQFNCNVAVLEAINTTLTEPGQATQHRAVWNAVGREEFNREQVLTSLQILRERGVLRSFKASGNNFQVFWARNEEPPVGEFEVNAAK